MPAGFQQRLAGRSKQASTPALPEISRGKTMKVRRRRTTRRSKRATPAAPPSILPPPDLTTEIEQAVEARDKFEEEAANFKAERDQSKSAFLRSFASVMSVVAYGPLDTLGRFAAWQAQEARATQVADAIYQLSAMFKERVEWFKSNSKGESVAALRRIIERLTAEREEPGEDKDAIDKRIGLLQAEQESLSAPLPAAPPQLPKDKTATPKSAMKTKIQPRERGGI
jgi:hypothetical protein